MVEGTPHSVWYYLALFLIDSLCFIFLAFKPYHMVNAFTFQYLLRVFGLSLPIKGTVQRLFESLQNQT